MALIAEKDSKLPFDIAQMRTIFFDHTDLRSADQCRQTIVTQLREAFNGAVDSPIATSVDVRNLQGGTAVERNVAELVTTMEQISSGQRQDALNIRRIARQIERLADRGEDRENLSPGAVRAAINSVNRLHALIDSRGDKELIQALADLEDPLEYIARRADMVGPSLIREAEAPQRIVRPKPQTTSEVIEEKPGEVVPEASEL